MTVVVMGCGDCQQVHREHEVTTSLWHLCCPPRGRRWGGISTELRHRRDLTSCPACAGRDVGLLRAFGQAAVLALVAIIRLGREIASRLASTAPTARKIK